ncbi:autotransporter domain-containing protein, partial [Fusobacterium sp. THCT1E2]
MIKKIMKAVKRGNKKRGRNITIGAVVGFLLSCTAVMGADNYLWINEDGGAIKFSIDGSTTIGKEHWLLDNPYTENTWDADTKTYTNNMILSSSEDNGIDDSHGKNVSYGFKLTGEFKLIGDLSRFNFINNGSIAAAGSEACCAIYNYEDTIINTLLNNGVITGESKNYNYGIYSDVDSRIETLTNNGVIAIEGTGAGIHNSASSIGNLINNGLIAGRDYTNYGEGIWIQGNLEGILINRGLIIGIGDSGYGIYNNDRIETLTNTGTIYGKDWAVTDDGDINSAYNYGIIANGTEGEPVIYGVKVINAAFDVNNKDIVMSDNPILNRGLIFTALGTGVYKAETEDYEQ